MQEFWEDAVDKLPALAALDQRLVQRMRHYMFANSITSLWFTTLRGYAPSVEEQRSGWLLGMATPLADHLVDEEQIGYEQVEGMIEGTSKHPLADVVQGLYHMCRQQHHQSKLFDELLEKTQRAQEASLEQQHNLTLKQHQKIMSDKGGYALLLYRSALKHECTTKESQMIYALGALMQLHNDIFDVYRDVEENINTIASQGHSIQELRSIYDRHVEEVFDLIAELPYPKINRKSLLLLINLVAETGHIALDQYEKLHETGAPFDPTLWTRKELVVDMDNVGRILMVVFRTLRKSFPALQ
ncbi:MAG: hypothetical protein KTR24_15555 [Saprospiraceae bacterium]|nr:hypothetical protein [Saprospiraceae bacterium]